MKEFEIKANDANQRVDKFIQKTCHKMPVNLMFRLIRQKKIKVNRKRCEPNQILNEGDKVFMFISEEFFEEKVTDISKAKKLTNIIYEDDNILVVDKEIGLLVHRDVKDNQDTLIDRILKYLVETHKYDPKKENSFTPALANRLDRNTAGLVLACKNASTLRDINSMMKNHQIEKHYVCIIEGSLSDKKYCHYYKKDKKKNIGQVFNQQIEGSSEIVLTTKTIHKGKKYSLLDVHLITGKSHQIRAQLAHLGHPLIGDRKYHGRNVMKHQALYAYQLNFHHAKDDLAYLNQLTIKQKDNFVIRKYEELEQISL